MKTNIFATLSLFLLSVFSANSSEIKQHIPNAETATLAVSGNCGMCKKNIETAASKKGVSAGTWSEATKVLTITYNTKKTTQDEILKRIAYAGYDNEKFLAPDAAYNKLHECCQYQRDKKLKSEKHDHAATNKEKATAVQTVKPLDQVYSAYFSLKDALVKDNSAIVSAQSKELLNSLNSVKMESLSTDEHTTFMNYLSELKTDAGHIAESKDIEHQREHFSSLSQNVYEVMKKIKPAYTVYLDHCPMYNDGKGANWISKETGIKNPFYGSKMMTCGKVTETIK